MTKYISLFVILGILTSSEAQSKIIDTLYSQVIPDAYENLVPYGNVKSVRSFSDFIYIERLDKKIVKEKYKYAFGKIEGFYTIYNTYGKRIGRYRLRDSINEFIIDTLKINRGQTRIYEYRDIALKSKYKTKWKIPFGVYNPYEVIVDRKKYNPYRYKVLKDSGLYKSVNTSFEYVLAKEDSTKIVEELSYKEYDMDLDGVIEERRPDQHNFYEYDEKDRIISKTFTFPHYEKYRRTMTRSSCIDGCFHSIPRSRTSKKTFVYDDQDNLLSYTLRVRGIAYKEEYTYKDGVLIKKDRYWPRPFIYTTPFWKLHERFYYNEKSAVTSIEGMNDDGSIDYIKSFTYTYDEKGNWIERKSYLDGNTIMGDDPFVITKRIIEYYN